MLQIFNPFRSNFPDNCMNYLYKLHKRTHNAGPVLSFRPYKRGPFERYGDSPYYSESELCGGAVTVSFSKYLPWQAMHFLQLSTHFSKSCCKPFAENFRRIVEQAVLTSCSFRNLY
jgi:hypothetical protein